VLALAACGTAGAPRPFRTPFGVNVAVEFAPGLQAPLDRLGPVWYMDWHWETPPIPGHERLFVVRSWMVSQQGEAVAEAMASSGPAWWSCGNEPNDPNQDNVSAEAYAALYRAFESRAEIAPQVRVVPAGIANADWEWAQAFREAYNARYGRYPRVDAWNIHNYMLESDQDPYDVEEFKRRIVAFRNWMEKIGDADKPLILSEFGVLYGNGCCGRPVDPPVKIQTFMRETVRWLLDSGAVSCWTWFSTRSEVLNGDLMTAEGELTDLGIIYRDLILEYSENR